MVNDNRFILGYVPPSEAEKAFSNAGHYTRTIKSPSPDGGTVDIPDPDSWVSSDAPFIVTPIDAPGLEHDNQFAIYRDGRVERAFTVYDLQDKYTEPFEPQEGGAGTGGIEKFRNYAWSASDIFEKTGYDVSAQPQHGFTTVIDSRWSITDIHRAPDPHGQDIDNVLSKVIGYVFTYIGSAFTSGIFGAAVGLGGGTDSAGKDAAKPGVPQGIIDPGVWDLLHPKPINIDFPVGGDSSAGGQGSSGASGGSGEIAPDSHADIAPVFIAASVVLFILALLFLRKG